MICTAEICLQSKSKNIKRCNYRLIINLVTYYIILKGTLLLNDYGDYQICEQKMMQTVYVRNDICEFDDEEIPIYTKNIDD